ncbi:MAG: hypothetical protein HZB98_15260 [Bacteroidia bacterium]|nr:hypothetical protein [Bacteroidia bacterium]
MTQSLISRKEKNYNLIIYCLFILIAVIGIFYGNAIKSNHAFLRIWDYQNILFLLLGVPFLFLQSKVNLPNFLEVGISNKQRFLKPILLGALFGILDIIVIKLLLHPEPYTELPPFLQPFPYSTFLYFSGALEIEVFYRLMPLTVILFLGKWISNGKYFNIFLWTAIVLTSLREPLEQLPNGELWLVAYSLLTGFLMNFLQAIYFKNAGFLASLSLRLGHYLFWHILLGIYVQYVELQ